MENQRLRELAGLLTEKKKDWTGDVKPKTHPEDGTFTKSAGGIVKELMKVHNGDVGKAMKALQFYITRAGKDVSNKEALDAAKEKLHAKLKKEEYDSMLRAAGIIVEKKKDPDMDMDDDMDAPPADDAPKGEGKKKDDEDEETLPKIVKKIAKKAVGKDVEELEDLIMKVYNAGHKDGMKEADGKDKKPKKDAPADDMPEMKDEVKEAIVEAVISELMDMGAMKKEVDKKEMRKRIIASGGNPFGGKKKDEKKLKEEELTEKHHVKKGKKVVKKGSKKDCAEYCDKNDGCTMHKGDPETEEVDEAHDEDLIDLESAISEDTAQIQAAMSGVVNSRVGKPVMTPKGKGVVSGIVKQAKTTADGKAGPYVHSVTVKMGDNTVHVMPANQVKLFKGKKPSGPLLPKSVSSTAINNADKAVAAQGGKESGTKPKTSSMWKA